MLPKTSTFKSLSYCKTPFNIPRFGRNYFSYTQHVGISVTVAQSTFAFKCLSQRLTFVSSSASTSLFAPSPIRVNCRAGRALEHTEGLSWYLVIKESKTETCQLGLQHPTNLCPRHKPSVSHTLTHRGTSACLDAKLVHSGQELKLLQGTSQKPKCF